MSDRRDIQPELIPTPEGLGGDVIISPDTLGGNRLPPRQSRTRKWQVLDAFGPPDIDLHEWQFEIGGLVESSLALNWEEFQKLPRLKVFADMHCVTRWSRLGNLWADYQCELILYRLWRMRQRLSNGCAKLRYVEGARLGANRKRRSPRVKPRQGAEPGRLVFQQYLRIQRRHHGNYKSRNSTNEGGAGFQGGSRLPDRRARDSQSGWRGSAR